MTFIEFAQQIVDDPLYRATIITRARAGTLPVDVELFLLETAADVRLVARKPAIPTQPPQSPTLALIRKVTASGKEA
jgi:hypothetical protein